MKKVYTAAFKAQVALDLLKEEKTISPDQRRISRPSQRPARLACPSAQAPDDYLRAAGRLGRDGLEQATFEQRALVELLIGCVVVTDAEVEIRYVMPLSRAGPHRRFCHLRLDYRGSVSARLSLTARGTPGHHALYGVLQSRAPHQALDYRIPAAGYFAPPAG
jgi:hypothetical protein